MTSNVQTIARGADSRIAQMRRTLVRDQVQWRALWAAHAGEQPAPVVDFGTRMVAAVFQGQRPTAGYDVLVTGTRLEGQALTVQVTEARPAPGAMLAQVIVSPFHIVSIPRFDGEVRFIDARGPVVEPQPTMPRPGAAAAEAPTMPHPMPAASGEAPPRDAVPAADPKPRPTPPPSASTSSTGLTPHFAGALAYLAGPFSGALLLAVESTSRYVRFHAWQALLGLGGLGVLAIAFLGLAFALLIASPNAFYALLWLAALSGIAWVGLWAVCVIQAYKGHEWKIPVAGGYAERWSR